MPKRRKVAFAAEELADRLAPRPPAVPKVRAAVGKPVRVEIPDWRPMLANEWAGKHWSVMDRGKKQAAEFIGVYAMAAGLKFTGPKFRCVRRLDIVLRVPWGRELPDPDAILKVTLDACKRCRVIVDDADSWCKWERPKFERGEFATIITVTDIEVGPDVDPNDDRDVKRAVSILSKRIERANRGKEKTNQLPAPVPPGKRRVPRTG